jgi:peptidase M48-like protein/PDZ domain-containing protein
MRFFSTPALLMLISALISALISGCASQTYSPPALSPDKVAAFEAERLDDAIGVQIGRLKRGHQLLWPLLAANTELCPKKRFSMGVLMSDREALGRDLRGITASQLAAHGVPDHAFALDVMQDGPAWQAGLRDGDRLIGVDSENFETIADLRKALSGKLKKGDAYTLAYHRSGVAGVAEITPAEICDAGLKVVNGDTMNAYAGTSTVTLYAGLMRVMDDDALQFILAHELAHVALKHVRKGTRNVIVSGAVIYVPVLALLGDGADAVLRRVDKSREISLRAKAIALAPGIESFEAEADYVGLYMLSRAGGNLDGAITAFEIFAREKPKSIWLRYTHPLTPERLAASKAAMVEIEDKRARGQALLPRRAR